MTLLRVPTYIFELGNVKEACLGERAIWLEIRNKGRCAIIKVINKSAFQLSKEHLINSLIGSGARSSYVSGRASRPGGGVESTKRRRRRRRNTIANFWNFFKSLLSDPLRLGFYFSLVPLTLFKTILYFFNPPPLFQGPRFLLLPVIAFFFKCAIP